MALSASERINLIQSAAKSLSLISRVDAELALEMFEVDGMAYGYANWESHGYDYAVDRLKPAPDDALLGLNAHLVSDSPLTPGAGSWEEGYAKVFLSHTSANRKLAGEVRNRLLGEGMELPEVWKHLEVSEATYHRWRAQFGGMKADDVKRLKELEAENVKLKRIVADQLLENQALREVNRGNW